MPDVILRPKKAAFVIVPLMALGFTGGGLALIFSVGQDVGATLALSTAAWLLPVYLIGIATDPQPYGTVRPPLSRSRKWSWTLGLAAVFLLEAAVRLHRRDLPPWVGIPLVVGMGGFLFGSVLHGGRQWRRSSSGRSDVP